ncbi:jg11566 [Pararge aegeria aegeria]|uniref:Jg11566 protein n=1 Tax=Pararge aegeria aegeria TaxID=348720 RepID=A0A8S4SEM9_9NEOP|nr:jg11566 [Pararge aegeria aegeria]
MVHCTTSPKDASVSEQNVLRDHHHHNFNRLKSTAGHRSFVESSKIHGPGPLVSSGSQRVAWCRLSTSLGADQRCVYLCGVAIRTPWNPNVYQFSELCSPPISTSALQLAELCR